MNIVNRKVIRKSTIGTVPVATVAVAILSLHAISVGARELEEVIVTATKREGTIQSLSAVVSAMTGE